MAGTTPEATVIIDIGKRWEDGIDHDPRSDKIVRFLIDYDFHHVGDYFGWKYGGDGDNGETLAYELDEYFAAEDIAKEQDNDTERDS